MPCQLLPACPGGGDARVPPPLPHHLVCAETVCTLPCLTLPYLSPSQFLFVRMASLPRAAADVPALQKELATFLGLSPPPADSAQSGVCLSATMITSKQVIVRAHNASVRDVKSAFRASPTARNLSAFLARHISPYLPISPPISPHRNLSAFFARHEALRTAIFERERVRVY